MSKSLEVRKQAFMQGYVSSIPLSLVCEATPYLCNEGSSFSVYKTGAVYRGLDFDITEEEFQQMTTRPCYLCGLKPSDGNCGVDRVDNSVGYILSNCCSCCNLCNMMKRADALKVFVERCKKISMRFAACMADLEELNVSQRARMKPRVKHFPVIPVLSYERRKVIIRQCRARILEWPRLKAVITHGAPTDEDLAVLSRLERDIEVAFCAALHEMLHGDATKKIE